jgi:hypothetical protein
MGFDPTTTATTTRAHSASFPRFDPIDNINQPRPEERALACVAKDGHRQDRTDVHPSRRPCFARLLRTRSANSTPSCAIGFIDAVVRSRAGCPPTNAPRSAGRWWETSAQSNPAMARTPSLAAAAARPGPGDGVVGSALARAGTDRGHRLSFARRQHPCIECSAQRTMRPKAGDRGRERRPGSRRNSCSDMRFHTGSGGKLWRRVAPRLLWKRRVDHDRLAPGRRMHDFG